MALTRLGQRDSVELGVRHEQLGQVLQPEGLQPSLDPLLISRPHRGEPLLLEPRRLRLRVPHALGFRAVLALAALIDGARLGLHLGAVGLLLVLLLRFLLLLLLLLGLLRLLLLRCRRDRTTAPS